MMKVICDTNVLIQHFKNDSATIEEMKKIGSENVLLPSVVLMEIFQGMTSKSELLKVKKKLSNYNILHFNEQTSFKAMNLVEKFNLSHNLQMPDAIIGAMSIVYDLPLFTYNIKDFRYLPKLKLYL